MKVLLEHKVPVASSCHGDGICGKCRVQVVAGAENLSSMQASEEILLQKNSIPAGWRISCQCQVLGPVTLDTGYW
jgi:2Fe-2S ferredoxin